MLGKTYDGQYCSVARSLEVIGERWSLLILREALLSGTSRFSDFQHNLGIATNVLATYRAVLDLERPAGRRHRAPGVRPDQRDDRHR